MKKLFLLILICQFIPKYSYAVSNVVLCASDVMTCEATGQDLTSCLSTSESCNKVRERSKWGIHACNKSCNRFTCSQAGTPIPAACKTLAETVVDGEALCPEDKVKNCVAATESLSEEKMTESRNMVMGIKALKTGSDAKKSVDKSGFMSSFRKFF